MWEILLVSEYTYKVYLPIDLNDLWKEHHRRNTKFVVLIPKMSDANKPNLLRLVDKIIMWKRVIVREHKRFKIYLSSAYNDLWEYLNRNNVKVDIVIILR